MKRLRKFWVRCPFLSVLRDSRGKRDAGKELLECASLVIFSQYFPIRPEGAWKSEDLQETTALLVDEAILFKSEGDYLGNVIIANVLPTKEPLGNFNSKIIFENL
jgi:hypothetical protein